MMWTFVLRIYVCFCWGLTHHYVCNLRPGPTGVQDELRVNIAENVLLFVKHPHAGS